jgi:subtilisin-like proprotein convertase family protein
MRRVLLSVVALLALGTGAQAQFMGTGLGGPIPDGTGSNVSGAPLISTINIPGSGPILDVAVSFTGLAHTWVGDVVITLTHPNGVTSMDIMSRPGRGSDNTFGFSSDYVAANSYSFSDAGADLFNAAPPATIPSGNYRPSSNPNSPGTNAVPYAYTPTSFASTFGGLDAAGVWTLTATDWAGGDTGSFTDWTLTITPVPEPTSFVLGGLVLSGIAWNKRRKKKATA